MRGTPVRLGFNAAWVKSMQSGMTCRTPQCARWLCVWSVLCISVVLLAGPPVFSAEPEKAAVDEPAQIEDVCRRISVKLASVKFQECLDRNLRLSGACSHLETPILFKEYPPLSTRTPQARVLVIGGTHGDEYASVSVTFKWMGILDRHHSGLFHWIFVPLLNPDGLLRDSSVRTNARGVDLNRNMPGSRWHEIGYQRWTERALKNPRYARYFPGNEPLSEPETAFLARLIGTFKPHAIVSLHSPLNLVDFDGPGRPPQKLGSLPLRRLGNFPGTLGFFGGIEQKIPVITVELASSARMPAPGEISAMWMDLVRWLIDNAPVPVAGFQVQAQEIELLDEDELMFGSR
jgi:murein peptide amidase A